MNDQQLYGLYTCPPGPSEHHPFSIANQNTATQMQQPQPQHYPPCSPFQASVSPYSLADGWGPCGQDAAPVPHPMTPPAQAYPPLLSPSFSAASSGTPPLSPQYQQAYCTSSQYPANINGTPPLGMGYPSMQSTEPSFQMGSFHSAATNPPYGHPAPSSSPYGTEMGMSMGAGAGMGLGTAATFPGGKHMSLEMPPPGYPTNSPMTAPGGALQPGYNSLPTQGPSAMGPLAAGMQRGVDNGQPEFYYPGRPHPEEGKFKLSEVSKKDMVKVAVKGARQAVKFAMG